MALYAPQVCNCGAWSIYGLSIGDVWVYGPNLTGLLLGLAQLALKLSYPSAAAAAAVARAPLMLGRKAAGGSSDRSDAEDDLP